MLYGAHRAGLIGQIRLRHPHIRGAEDAFAWAGIGLRQNGDRRHTGECPHRLHANPLEQARVWFQLSRRDQFVINRNQHGFIEIPAVFQGMMAQSLRHIAPATNLIKHIACQIFFIGCKEMGFSPAFSLVYLHLKPVYGFSWLPSTAATFIWKSLFNSETSLCWNISVCRPHSILLRPCQRPARSSSLMPIATVQGAHPTLRYPFSSNG